jgi:chromosome segregation ATPase
MASMQKFDAEIEKTRQTVEKMNDKLKQSGIVLEEFAKSETIGQSDFDIENARINDILAQQKVMESNIADLIIGLEDATNVFGTEFESMKSYTGWEKFVGLFSKQKMQRMRTDRVRNMSLAGNLQELLAKSDRIVGILQSQKEVLDSRYASSEASLRQVIERRKSTVEQLETVQERIEELNPMLLDLENQISATTDSKKRTELEGKRSELATEYNQQQAKEQELLAESQTLERYTSMFQTFVDSLNNQLAAQQTLINKLTIDTEQRVVLYKSLEDSLKTAAQQDVAHKINTLGNQVDTAAEETMAGIGAAAQSHIGDLLEMHEKNMVSTEDIQRRKKLADEAFARRFETVMKKHDSGAYVG